MPYVHRIKLNYSIAIGFLHKNVIIILCKKVKAGVCVKKTRAKVFSFSVSCEDLETLEIIKKLKSQSDKNETFSVKCVKALLQTYKDKNE